MYEKKKPCNILTPELCRKTWSSNGIYLAWSARNWQKDKPSGRTVNIQASARVPEVDIPPWSKKWIWRLLIWERWSKFGRSCSTTGRPAFFGGWTLSMQFTKPVSAWALPFRILPTTYQEARHSALALFAVNWQRTESLVCRYSRVKCVDSGWCILLHDLWIWLRQFRQWKRAWPRVWVLETARNLVVWISKCTLNRFGQSYRSNPQRYKITVMWKRYGRFGWSVPP